MSDLTDEQLEWRLKHAMSTNEREFRAVILEVQRHRAGKVSEERIRAVVWHAVRHFTEVDDVTTGAIARRAAEQLAGSPHIGGWPEVGDPVRWHQSSRWPDELGTGTVIRIQTGPSPFVVRWPVGVENSYRASELRPAPTPCYQDPASATARCAAHDEVPDWHSEVRGYTGPAGWICASGGLFDDAKGAAARAEYDAAFAADPLPPPVVDYLAGIRTILASDMPGEAIRKALRELAGIE